MRSSPSPWRSMRPRHNCSPPRSRTATSSLPEQRVPNPPRALRPCPSTSSKAGQLMPEPEVALVFSPESWVEGVHRHLTDHGGARVRQVVMDPALALEEDYDTLIVSHRWPRSEEHTSELQSRENLVCRLL